MIFEKKIIHDSFEEGQMKFNFVGYLLRSRRIQRGRGESKYFFALEIPPSPTHTEISILVCQEIISKGRKQNPGSVNFSLRLIHSVMGMKFRGYSKSHRPFSITSSFGIFQARREFRSLLFGFRVSHFFLFGIVFFFILYLFTFFFFSHVK